MRPDHFVAARIRRRGGAGKPYPGLALHLLVHLPAQLDAKQARELIGILREANAVVPPQLEEMSMFGGGGGRGEYMCSQTDWTLADGCFSGRYGGGGRGRGGGGGGRYGGHDNGYGGRNNDRW